MEINNSLIFVQSTGLDSGLEYLADGLEELHCAGKLTEWLKAYWKNARFDYQAWRRDNPELILNAQRTMELEEILININKALTNSHAEKLAIQQGLDVFMFETQSRIDDLRRENQELHSQIQIPPKPPTS